MMIDTPDELPRHRVLQRRLRQQQRGQAARRRVDGSVAARRLDGDRCQSGLIRAADFVTLASANSVSEGGEQEMMNATSRSSIP